MASPEWSSLIEGAIDAQVKQIRSINDSVSQRNIV